MANPGAETAHETADDSEHRVMHIRFGIGNEERVEETLAALDRGEEPGPYFERVYRDVDNLHRVTRPKNLELLRVLATERPKSIRETARFVDRDVRQVHRNLEELADLDLIEFETDGPGKPKRPTVWYDEIAVELPLTAGNGASEDSAEA
ncbi:HVO_A0114 family putative DNA-binding protein [Halegenticoccus tardaugens]|uniref:HVO_A0114 family putative DNA-binding protein n=1 Tax=Halegenticoccus tardaugens TaxID=2071624 RepID=UPI00100BC85B|nr:transcriptional regulator [Halegenticoccus tardaugens]